MKSILKIFKSLKLPSSKTVQKAKPSISLQKSRPLSLQENYILLEDNNEIDKIFIKFKEHIYNYLNSLVLDKNKLQKVFLKEHGRISGNRNYFFIQPINEAGWLIERSGKGWVISKAQKIVANNTFLRQSEPWDVVTVYAPKYKEGTIRVTSQRFQTPLLSLLVYEEKFLKNLTHKNYENK